MVGASWRRRWCRRRSSDRAACASWIRRPRDGADRQAHHHACPRTRSGRGCAIRSRASSSYVPPGSVAKGKALVETGGGGKTVACAICHGDGMKGLANVPRLAGVHPIYLARQLHLFKDGIAERPRRAADEAAGRAADRRRHPEHLRVSRTGRRPDSAYAWALALGSSLFDPLTERVDRKALDHLSTASPAFRRPRCGRRSRSRLRRARCRA